MVTLSMVPLPLIGSRRIEINTNDDYRSRCARAPSPLELLANPLPVLGGLPFAEK